MRLRLGNVRAPIVTIVAIFLSTNPAFTEEIEQRVETDAVQGSLEFLFLTRDETRGIGLGVIDRGPDRLVVRSNQLEFRHRQGVRASLGYRRSDTFGYRFSIFHLGDHRATVRVDDPESGDDLEPVFEDGSAIDDDDFRDSDAYVVNLRSRHYGANFAVLHRFRSMGPLSLALHGGIRLSRFTEDLGLVSFENLENTTPQNIGIYTIQTDNLMFGPVIGGQLGYAFGSRQQFSLVLDFTLGLYGNRARQSTGIINDGVNEFSGDNEGINLSTSTETGVSLAWWPWENVRLRAGYSLFYLSGVALASHQFAEVNAFNAFTGLNKSGSVLFHGGTFEISYYLCEHPCSQAPRSSAPAAGPWYFYGGAEAVYMNRKLVGDVITSIDDQAETERLGTDNLDAGWRPGFRATVGAGRTNFGALEVSYLHLGSFISRAAAIDTNENLDTVFQNEAAFDDDDFQDAFSHVIEYRSSLHSLEANYVRPLGRFLGLDTRVLAGFRYTALDEGFSLTSRDEPPASTDVGFYNIETSNHLYGAQFGVAGTHRLDFVHEALSVTLSIKGGLFLNRSRQESVLRNDNARELTAKASRTGASSIVEAGVSLNWEPVENLFLTVGYQVMRLGGVALAPLQFATSNTFGGFSQLNTNGSVLYHGVSAGLIYRFRQRG